MGDPVQWYPAVITKKTCFEAHQQYRYTVRYTQDGVVKSYFSDRIRVRNDAGRSAYDMAPDTILELLDERDRAVATAAAAASIMSGLCGENTGNLLASFLATPWMLSAADELLTDQPMPEWVAFGAKLSE